MDGWPVEQGANDGVSLTAVFARDAPVFCLELQVYSSIVASLWVDRYC